MQRLSLFIFYSDFYVQKQILLYYKHQDSRQIGTEFLKYEVYILKWFYVLQSKEGKTLM